MEKYEIGRLMGSFETITTDSAEVHYVVFDFSSKTGTGNNVYMVDRIHFQIKDACAFSTRKRRLRYTVPRLIFGNSSLKFWYTVSAVGCDLVDIR